MQYMRGLASNPAGEGRELGASHDVVVAIDMGQACSPIKQP